MINKIIPKDIPIDTLIKYTIKLVIFLFILSYIHECNNSRILEKRLKVLELQVSEIPTKSDLIIEGLKTEKRMIQSTDRRMLDVERQTQIDLEIDLALKNKK